MDCKKSFLLFKIYTPVPVDNLRITQGGGPELTRCCVRRDDVERGGGTSDLCKRRKQGKLAPHVMAKTRNMTDWLTDVVYTLYDECQEKC